MDILLIGSGGREHALAWKLAQSSSVGKIYAAPGNPGIAAIGKCTCISLKIDDLDAVAAFAEEKGIGLTVVGPEAPLVAGIADVFAAKGLPVFGPSKAAARLEGSKAFAKAIMAKYHIPTAGFEVFSDVPSAIDYVKKHGAPIVVKADGLAAGKGVVVATNEEEALAAVYESMHEHKFGAAGAKVVLEDFLEGEEASLLAFSDGKTVVPMIPSQDHKRVFDRDLGPNTGGMGTYAPAPVMTEALRAKAVETILKPIVTAMAAEGMPYAGCLYAGLMVKGDSVKVVEFNCRFGDPETQVVLPLLEGDLAEIMLACATGTLDKVKYSWSDKAAVCVVLTSGGYPGTYAKGKEITGLGEAALDKEVVVFHAGTKAVDRKIVTDGGRVLGVTALGDDIKSARDRAYAAAAKINFDNVFYRRDIAWRAFKR